MKAKLALCLLLLSLSVVAASDPWPPSAILAPAKLAAELKDNSAPSIIYVGFPILYKGAHIAKAVFAGPGSKPEGLKLLTDSVKLLPFNTQIVIYCGCCPFDRCPNIRPAYEALKKAGYTQVRVLELETNLHSDWVEKGYPTDTK